MELFGSSGIRDIVTKEFLQLAFEVGLAVGNLHPSVIVGSDTRTSGDAMKYAFISGLLSAGSKAYDAGIVPTPTLAYTTRNFEAGAMITASHNPPEYNGIKLWNRDGSAFDAAQRDKIRHMIFNKAAGLAPWERMERCRPYISAIHEHSHRVLADFGRDLGIKVVVDCGGGAASLVTPDLLKALQCRITTMNCHPSGYPPRGSEPIAANLEGLMRAVQTLGADLGIAHDGDGDRMVAIDGRGRFISGDKLMVLFIRSLKAKKVVTTVDASMVLEELGVEVVRTEVGDAFVSEGLRRGGDFGGEPSASWIFPEVSYCPDGIYAAAKIAEIAAAGRLSSLVDEIPSYPIFRGSVAVAGLPISKLEQRLLRLEPLSVSKIDGIRLAVADGWLLIRASGTEPKLRITAEATSEKRMKELYNFGLEAIKECLREYRGMMR